MSQEGELCYDLILSMKARNLDSAILMYSILYVRNFSD